MDSTQTTPVPHSSLEDKSSALEGLLERPSFLEIMPLRQFAQPFVPDEGLWNALVAAARETLDFPPAGEPCRGLIVAEQPLLGLIAAQLFGMPSIGIPLGRNDRANHLGLQAAVAMHVDLRRFVRDSRSLVNDSGPLLMLGWTASGMTAATEAVFDEIDRSAAFAPGLICLVQRGSAAESAAAAWGAPVRLPVLADVAACAREIVKRTLLELELPAFIDVSTEEKADRLIHDLIVSGSTLGTLVNALNTPAHGGFQRLVSRLQMAERPSESDVFRRFVMNDREDQPRHAASLFLVSHFPDLTPAQFIELGDTLANQTSSFQTGPRWRKRPAAVTDVVLSECGISFVQSASGSATAALASALDAQSSDPLGVNASEHLRRQFDRDAPLLKERYLHHLSGELLLGHPSNKVSRQYAELEVAALRAAESIEDRIPGNRLRRIVYGAPHPVDQMNPERAPRLREAFLLATLRAPELVDTLVGSAGNAQLREVVAALCGSRLFPSDYESTPAIRQASASVFWVLYASFQGRLTLDGFPSLFTTSLADGQQRRVDCLNMLRTLLGFGDETFRPSDLLFPQFQSPGFLSRLVADIAEAYPRIVGNRQEWVDVAMLVEAGRSYLRHALRDVPWKDVAAWWPRSDEPAVTASDGVVESADGAQHDLALARVVLSPRFVHWLIEPERRPSESDGGDGNIPRTRELEARTQMQMVHAVLDGVVGVASFGDSENLAFDVWLNFALVDTERHETRPRVDDDVYEQLFGTVMDATDGETLSVRSVLTPVILLFPLLLLMAATRNAPAVPDDRDRSFTFSSDLRDWLAIGKGVEVSPAERLLELIELAFALQQQWQESHDRIWIVDLDWDPITAAMIDREEALIAFRSILEPIARDSRLSRQTTGAKAEPRPAAAPIASATRNG